MIADEMSHLSPADTNQRMCFHGWFTQFEWYIAELIPNHCPINHIYSFKTALNVYG